MKTKLLKRLRKRFDWKYSIFNGRKVLYVYDKQWICLYKNSGYEYGMFLSDLEYLLQEYGDVKLIEKQRIKRIKLHFKRL